MTPNNRPILLIEDNPMDIDLTKRAFTKRKVLNSIEIARDGEEALKFLTRWEAGDQTLVVILLDLKLPKFSGLEVLHALKTHPDFQTIPVIVLTSSAEDNDIKTAYELGANSYIVKPVDFDKFINVASEIEIYWLATTVLPE